MGRDRFISKLKKGVANSLHLLGVRTHPIRVLIILTIAVILAEVLGSITLHLLHPEASILHIILDAVIILVATFPVLYFLAYRPLQSVFSAYQKSEKALQAANLELEVHVANRTNELLETNEALRREMEDRWRAEAELHLQTQAVEAAANGIVITDLDGNVSWANPAFEAMTGYSLTEILGRKLNILKSGQHPAKYYANLWDTILAGKVWRGEIINRRKDGSTYVEEQTITPVFNPNQDLTHFIAIKQDITKRKEAQNALENERERLYSLLDGLPAYVYLKAPDYSIRFANRQFHDLFGNPNGKLCYQVVRGREEPCQECPTIDVFDKSLPFQWERQLPDGRIFQLYDYPYQEYDGTDLVMQLGIDITARKKALSALEERNRELQMLSAEERTQRLLSESLFEAAQALNESLDMQEVLDRILEQVQRVIPYDTAAIMLIDDNELRLAGIRGRDGIPAPAQGLTEGLRLDSNPIFQSVCQGRQHVLIDDTYADRSYQRIKGLEWARSILAVPLIFGDDVLGLITLVSERRATFNLVSANQLDSFASHAVLAINNASLYQAEQIARSTAEIMRDASQVLTTSLDLDEVLSQLLDYLYKMIPYDSACILLQGEESYFTIEAAHGYERFTDVDIAGQSSIDPYQASPINTIWETGAGLLIPDIQQYPQWQPPAGHEHVRSWLGIPMLVSDRMIGFTCLEHTLPGYFTSEHQQWADALVRQAVAGIHNAQLFREVQASQSRLKALSHQLVEIQENERRFVARELHDEASQALTALKVELRLLDDMGGDRESIHRATKAMKATVDTVMENLHRLAIDLHPSSLDRLGLLPALNQYGETLSQKYGIDIQVESLGMDERLAKDIETNLYRIAQEGVANSLRHAHASNIAILLEKRGPRIVLIIEDNGDGFNPQNIHEADHLGLFGIRERAQMLGGDLTIESKPGSGTTLYVEVPDGD